MHSFARAVNHYTSNTMDETDTSLFRLPPELRNRIYDLVCLRIM